MDKKTEAMIALSAAIGANCIPCFDFLYFSDREIPMLEIVYRSLNTPIGWVSVGVMDDAVVSVSFATQPEPVSTDNPVAAEAVRQLSEYFAGKRKRFDLPLDLKGTPFQRSVWKALQEIPFGQTATYKEIAHAVGNPKAVRAVGGANNKNPVAILVPCHRVIGSDGSLTGYASGLWRKQWLLEKEGVPLKGA